MKGGGAAYEGLILSCFPTLEGSINLLMRGIRAPSLLPYHEGR